MNSFHRIGDQLIHFAGNADLIQTLVKFRVDMLLVGGLAMAWYCPSRRADDLDLLYDPSKENASRLGQALKHLNIVNFTQADIEKYGSQIQLGGPFYAELLSPSLSARDFAALAANCEIATLHGQQVKVASIETLIQLKNIAMSHTDFEEKHLNDFQALKHILTCRGAS